MTSLTTSRSPAQIADEYSQACFLCGIQFCEVDFPESSPPDRACDHAVFFTRASPSMS
jgi:hypothetical protein